MTFWAPPSGRQSQAPPYVCVNQDVENNTELLGCISGDPMIPTPLLCSPCSSINVTLGAHNIKQQERAQQVIRVRRAICHPDYNPKNYSNDIMLLKLERKAKQTSAVKPLRLPRAKARVKPGQVCSLAGWGQVAPGTPATTLEEAEVTVQEDQVCESLYPRHYSRATQKCVRDPKKPSPCSLCPRGDSRGPLMCNGVAHGIVFYGEEHGRTPYVYMRISSFLSWIQTTMSQ
uniref:Peptidase S1 domain-containing protein n=1 Tax=Capra hircus TaxID=9925 RepID=A0A8C2P8N3_CAPHI